MGVSKYLASLAVLAALTVSGCADAAKPATSNTAASSSPTTQSASAEPSNSPSESAAPSHSSSATPSSATATPKPSPSKTNPKLALADLGLTGMLVYHSYSVYGAWDAELYGIDLATGRRAHLNAKWTGMISPINAHFSPDGTLMTFMGTDSSVDEHEWDVFVSEWTGTEWGEPRNLTGPNDKRDEDPKFSPNGSTIAYKQNGVLALVEADGSGKRLLTLGEDESSMPYFNADGSALLFERGGSIWLHTIAGGAERLLWKKGVSYAYYPIGATADRFLFTEVQASQHDRLSWGYYDGRKAQPLFNGSNQCDNSDPYPYLDGKRFVFYVTGCAFIFKGGYNLAVLDQQTERVFDIDELNPNANSHNQELGPVWLQQVRLP